MKKDKILIVEDDKRIAEVLKQYFEEEYFDVFYLNTGEGVVDHVKSSRLDLILLDIMLPCKDGITICREIRSFSNIPIIFITAKVEDLDRLLGLEYGADDYICKPFIPREVLARVKAVLRRNRSEHSVTDENKLFVGPLNMDEESCMVTIGGSNIDLTPTEYQLLRTMMKEPDRVFTRKDLLFEIHGCVNECYNRTIDKHIRNLRKKINFHLQGEEIIRTFYGFGYKFDLTSEC